MDELKEWDLVYIIDSTGWGVVEKFSKNIERDNGKTVQIHNYAIGDLSALQVLKALQIEPDLLENNTFKSLQGDIADAEVIVFFANHRGDPAEGGVEGGIENYIHLQQPPGNCSLELYEPYIENLKAIYHEILALRNGKRTIIRAVDFCNPLISIHRERNMEIECTKCLEIFNAAVRQAADAFNGPIHNEDPREKGYIGTDGVHTSEKGQQAIADLLSEVGYEPIEL